MRDATSFWDREIHEPQHSSWLHDWWLREYANEQIGGDMPLWPMDWFQRWLEGRTFERALTIGCGTGGLERDLVRRNIVASIDALDGSIASLAVAKKLATDEGLQTRIRYYAGDFNAPALPRRTYDLILFQQSAHHVLRLEKLFRVVLHALKPGGLVYLDEYVGPSRFDWTEAMMEPYRRIYFSLDPSLRAWEELGVPVMVADPSEAVRSSDIEKQLAIGFDVAARRPYGGNLVSVLYPALTSLPADVREQLLAEERRWLAAGAGSFHTVLVIRSKRGLRRALGSARYWLVPKLQRIARECARLRRG
ncbi:MAG TPA: class I SAM-dependent methyltransferase [Thermoanaerobaculia bacterium]|nr:class I SAM-dependent methyltransferase [Thermoanaerobaculia bacterium]